MPENQIGLWAKFIGAGITALGAAFGAGKYNSVLVKKKELYNPDGSPIYFTVKEATEKFDKIIGYMVKQNDESKEIAKFMGSVEQYIKNHKR